MRRHTISALGWSLGLLLALTLGVLATRSYFPIDETRYLSVAWEMWLRNDFLVPHLNGETYSHKPPLLFWLIHLGWWLFGVNEWSPRLIVPLFGAGSLLLTARIGRRLWPDRGESMSMAGPALLASLVWVYFSTAVMFDMLVTFFTLMGLTALLSVWRTGRSRGWLWFGAAIGLGILAKGPVILLYTLPPALLARVWTTENVPRNWLHWYAGLGAGVALGAAIGLAWALPAASAGGQDYANAILWGQTADRLSDSFAHRRPVWWYLAALPLALAPLLLWTGFTRGLGEALRHLREPGVRFCLTWLLPVFVLLSLISGKQVHYLLPIVPPLILLMLRGLPAGGPADRFLSLGLVLMISGGALTLLPLLAQLNLLPGELPWWATEIPAAPGWLLVGAGLAVAIPRRTWPNPRRLLAMAGGTGLVALAVQLSLLQAAGPAFDLHRASLFLRGLELEGVPLAHASEYHGQYHFLGRLERPFTVLSGRDRVQAWLGQHPDAAAVSYPKPWSAELLEHHVYAQPYRGRAMVVSFGTEVTR